MKDFEISGKVQKSLREREVVFQSSHFARDWVAGIACTGDSILTLFMRRDQFYLHTALDLARAVPEKDLRQNI